MHGFGYRKVLFSGQNMEAFQPIIQKLQTDRPQIQIYQALTHYDALQLILSLSFDLMVSETGTRAGMDLIDMALSRQVPTLGIFDGKAPPGSFRPRAPQVTFIHFDQNAEDIVKVIDETLAIQCRSRWKRLWDTMGQLPVRAITKMSPKKTDPEFFGGNVYFY